ncbi:ABC transporter permease [Xylophilus ampelinus]|uniref:Lipopolysaccharide transport system permease protein n=1 Tax=Xylophilus ampelinus TaxID=54067 RepID=A0A318SIX6_9BURK|nr:ABC transporter permease [Xylophilus ampelinus]MCS4509746.1 ABC transporter permease [Xylophilus ampelinus]PYE78726.1 lipopolysaccharide transport system permease protein [Xylophilus ampelinus]
MEMSGLKPLSQFQLLITDVCGALKLWRFWLHLGLEDILKQYRRSFLGPVWISVNTAIFIGAFGLIGSQVFKIDVQTYLPFFCVSHVLFLFLSQSISDSCQTFIASSAFLKQTPYPKTAFGLRVIWRNLLMMGHNIPIAVLVLLAFGRLGDVRLVPFVLGLAFTMVCAALVSCILGALCARFRDIPMIVTSLMQIAMFLTPVMWQPSQLSERAQLIVHINPLAAFLDLVRAPVLGQSVNLYSYLMACGTFLVLLIAFFTIFLQSRRRLVYWL